MPNKAILWLAVLFFFFCYVTIFLSVTTVLSLIWPLNTYAHPLTHSRQDVVVWAWQRQPPLGLKIAQRTWCGSGFTGQAWIATHPSREQSEALQDMTTVARAKAFTYLKIGPGSRAVILLGGWLYLGVCNVIWGFSCKTMAESLRFVFLSRVKWQKWVNKGSKGQGVSEHSVWTCSI